MPSRLVLDFDGTLHNSIKIYAPALRKVYAGLVADGLAPEREFTDEEIGKWLGWSPKDMWDAFAPGLPDEVKLRCIDAVGQGMLGGIRAGMSELYPGTEDVLAQLRGEGNTLIFLSNCRHDYMEAFREELDLDRFFSGYYCSEDYAQIPKPQIFEHIRDDFAGVGEGEFVAIGDRFHDMELAHVHGLRCIGCLYGFGDPEELAGATATVTSITQIPEVLAAWR